MAERIEFHPALRNPREALYHRLEHAPQQHVEALLDAYDILQLLHDKGILEIIKGALGSGEKLLQIAAETMETEEAVRTIRNLVIVLKIVGSLEPDMLDRILRSMSRSVTETELKKPPGLMRLMARFASVQSRRALTPLATALESVGQNLDGAKKPLTPKRPRKKTTRHSA